MSMKQIIDVDHDVVGYINNSWLFNFFIEVAEKEKLQFLKSFLDNGFSIDIPDIVEEINTIDWPMANGVNEAASHLLKALLLAKGGIVFITQE